MNTPLPKVKDCIPYIESCGWTFKYTGFNFHSNRVYVFVHPKRGMMGFTTRELRHAKINGW